MEELVATAEETVEDLEMEISEASEEHTVEREAWKEEMVD